MTEQQQQDKKLREATEVSITSDSLKQAVHRLSIQRQRITVKAFTKALKTHLDWMIRA